MSDPKQILAAATRILLVDWPSTSVPRTLIAAGFTVFGSSPSGYSEATVAVDRPPSGEGTSVFPPENESDGGYLVFRRLVGTPGHIDIANVYRPEEELQSIIEHHLLPLGVAVLWLQPPNTSEDASALARANGLAFVEGIDIADVARQLSGRKP